MNINDDNISSNNDSRIEIISLSIIIILSLISVLSILFSCFIYNLYKSQLKITKQITKNIEKNINLQKFKPRIRNINPNIEIQRNKDLMDDRVEIIYNKQLKIANCEIDRDNNINNINGNEANIIDVIDMETRRQTMTLTDTHQYRNEGNREFINFLEKEDDDENDDLYTHPESNNPEIDNTNVIVVESARCDSW